METRTQDDGEVGMDNELNVLALIKGTEHYVFVYDDDSRPQLLDTLRDQAADPSLSLSWFDAMVLTTKAREQAQMEATPLTCQESGARDQGSGIEDQESENTRPRRFGDTAL